MDESVCRAVYARGLGRTWRSRKCGPWDGGQSWFGLLPSGCQLMSEEQNIDYVCYGWDYDGDWCSGPGPAAGKAAG